MDNELANPNIANGKDNDTLTTAEPSIEEHLRWILMTERNESNLVFSVYALNGLIDR